VTVIRQLKRRFGIAAPRVAVHTHAPWYLRWGLIFAGFGVMLAVAWITYDVGRNLAGFQSGKAAAEQARLIEEVAHLRDENAELRSHLAAVEGQMQIERATHGNLASQMKTLTDENALIKEDLAFFQTLMTSSGDAPGGVSINRFRVRPDALPGEYRYQLLVVQSRTRSREFQGKLQLIVDLVQDGQPQVLVLPRADEKADPYNLSFKFYHRVEGVFHVPPEATVKRVQVRVLENGTEAPKSSQTVNLS
jgi:hypothetical protein